MCNADLPTCLLICQNLVVRRLDLSSMKTVRDFAREVIETEERLDVLVRSLTKRGNCSF